VIYRSNDSAQYTGPFNSELIDLLPESVKFIVHNGAGYDNIDIGACDKRGIQVSNTPGAVSNATADIALFLMLGALRKLSAPLKAVRQGNWRAEPGKEFRIGNDPKDKTLGIIGLGGIGMAVAKRAEGFGMKVKYYKRTKIPDCSYEYVDFDTLLKTSDVISLNLALTQDTKGIIGAKEFDAMKDGVCFINTARGGLVDEKALVEALKKGKVGSAGLDVFEHEPKIEKELLEMDNVMCLPHVGTATYETQRDMELLVLENLKSAVTQGKLITQVPEQK
jgi:glyoxylate reductase